MSLLPPAAPLHGERACLPMGTGQRGNRARLSFLLRSRVISERKGQTMQAYAMKPLVRSSAQWRGESLRAPSSAFRVLSLSVQHNIILLHVLIGKRRKKNLLLRWLVPLAAHDVCSGKVSGGSSCLLTNLARLEVAVSAFSRAWPVSAAWLALRRAFWLFQRPRDNHRCSGSPPPPCAPTAVCLVPRRMARQSRYRQLAGDLPVANASNPAISAG
ncbi:hypothetical protein DPEC_G00108720 [Dallia pectoralis]|uniref:Uncharacterized protein n=1 Tax=Dallia pectoralis TaxID=75939 RepID=A0ACC2GSE5_DALPE|nr:hypothetical protein DPEC_G00108720 [Dallia pectoralis]